MTALLALAALVALVGYDVTNTRLFQPLRDALDRASRRWPDRCRGAWQCHFCLGHHVAWVALAASGWCQRFTGTWLDWPLTWAAVVVLAQPITVLVDWSIDAVNSFDRLTGKEPTEP